VKIRITQVQFLADWTIAAGNAGTSISNSINALCLVLILKRKFFVKKKILSYLYFLFHIYDVPLLKWGKISWNPTCSTAQK
jgi:hypothetical protein